MSPEEPEDGPSLRRFLRNSAYGLLTALLAGAAAAFWIFLTLSMGGY